MISDFSDVSSSENEDFELRRAPRIFRHRRNPLIELNDREFKMRFRLSKPVVEELEQRLRPQLRTRTKRNRALNPMFMILLTLRFYATGSFQMVIGDIFNVNKETVSRIIHKVTREIAVLRPQFIKMPTEEEEIRQVMRGFYDVCNFPRVIGSIGCTHIPIISPGGNNAEFYRNDHGWFSLNVQAICDSKLRFQNVVARWPGSAHDSYIFMKSRIHAQFEAAEFPQSILLGDSKYQCCHYLLTPTMHEETSEERAYNRAHKQTRSVIEQSFGVLKKRFPCLRMQLGVKLLQVPPIIVATFVLHNIAINADDSIPEVDWAIFRGRRIYQELPVPDVNQMDNRENTALRTALINNTFRFKSMEESAFVKCEPAWSLVIKEEPSNFKQQAVLPSGSQVKIKEDPHAVVNDPCLEGVDITVVKEPLSEEDEMAEPLNAESDNTGNSSPKLENTTALNVREVLSCDVCRRMFLQRCDLKRHSLTHTGERPFRCSLCSRTFSQQAHLKTHQLTHEPVKPFKCSNCDSSFRRVSHLRIHESSHTGSRPFVCTVCGKTFRNSSDLRRHKINHIQIKHYSCSVCASHFNKLSNLRRHEITHTESRPFLCNICGKSFRNLSNLGRHQSTHSDSKAIPM